MGQQQQQKKQPAPAAQVEQRAPVAKRPDRMEDVMDEFTARVKKLDAELQDQHERTSILDERVAVMQELMGRELQPSEVVKLAKRIRIMIHKSEKKDAVDPVPISVNGYTVTVQRGMVVEIPEHFLEALENAVETHFTFYQDKNDQSVLHKEERDAPAYPYSVNPRVPQRGERPH